MTDDRFLIATRVILDRLRSRHRKLFAIPPTASVERVVDEVDRWTVTVQQEILSERLGTVQFARYADWREGVKAAFYQWLGTGDAPPGHWPWLGDYLRRRWPVKMHREAYTARALYPNISIPHEPAVYTFIPESEAPAWPDDTATDESESPSP